VKERIEKLKKEYLEKKQQNPHELKESSDFMNYCEQHSVKYQKFFPHLNTNERTAKLWEKFCAEWQNNKESESI
jgi:hypothetical protein